MNDFTKEELKKIADGLWRLDDLNDDEGEFDAIIIKIRLMIDNYCECHQWILKFDAINSIYRECMNCKEKSK